MTEHVDCRFCRELAANEVIANTEAHLAVASYGALLEGWSLAIPKRHALATADLEEGEWNNFIEFTKQLVARVQRQYGVMPVVFEHGPSGEGRLAGCGVDHAHVHVVPIDMDLRPAVAALGGPPLSGWTTMSGQPQRDGQKDYLWLIDATGSWVWHSTAIGSQIVRRAIANQLGDETWDWKQDLREGTVRASAARLRLSSSEPLAS